MTGSTLYTHKTKLIIPEPFRRKQIISLFSNTHHMIQRRQSIFLLFAALSIFALYLFPLVHNIPVDGKSLTISVTGVSEVQNGVLTHTQTFLALSIVTAIVGLIPLYAIFQYKNRQAQIAYCYSAMLVVIGFTFWVEKTVSSITNGASIAMANFGIGVLLSSISLIFLVGAIRGIRRDEKLVKSADRLR